MKTDFTARPWAKISFRQYFHSWNNYGLLAMIYFKNGLRSITDIWFKSKIGARVPMDASFSAWGLSFEFKSKTRPDFRIGSGTKSPRLKSNTGENFWYVVPFPVTAFSMNRAFRFCDTAFFPFPICDFLLDLNPFPAGCEEASLPV